MGDSNFSDSHFENHLRKRESDAPNERSWGFSTLYVSFVYFHTFILSYFISTYISILSNNIFVFWFCVLCFGYQLLSKREFLIRSKK